MIAVALDDKQLALEALTDAIRRAEPTMEIHAFRSSAEVLRFMQEKECDVAFLDIDMPGMNGVALARELKLRHPTVNVVFATGYQEFAGDALDLHCSGYLLKPITPEKVRRELDDLRYPVTRPAGKRVKIQTFGNFEVFVDGKPLKFKYEKAKELLAYLVDRGTFCSNREIGAALWEEKDVSDSYIRTIRKELTDVLRQAGCEEILMLQRGRMGVMLDATDCDCNDWKKGVPSALNAYRGEYMSQYSWGELTHAAMESGR